MVSCAPILRNGKAKERQEERESGGGRRREAVATKRKSMKDNETMKDRGEKKSKRGKQKKRIECKGRQAYRTPKGHAGDQDVERREKRDEQTKL